MSARKAFGYWQAITPVEASEALLAITIAKAPHMKAEQRKKLESALRKQSQVRGTKKVLTTEEIFKRLLGK